MPYPRRQGPEEISLAENTDSPEGVRDASEAILTRASLRAQSSRAKAPRPQLMGRARGTVSKVAAAPTPVIVSAAPAAVAKPRAPRGRKGPIRSLFTILAVTGMVATVAIPAYAAWQPTEEATATLQQLAEGGAQTLIVASDVETSDVARDSYAATTPEEIQAKKDEEERIAREAAAKAAAAAAAASRYSSSVASIPSGTPLVAPGSGEVRRPLPYFDNFGEPYAGHKGTDYMVGRGTPIYAVADGTIVESTETSNGWGVMVKIAHNLGGASVTTLYAHMLYGSRLVQVGDQVSAGQMIGQVSDTGRAFGTHLHLEVVVNGSYQVPESWLAANAG